MSSTLSTTVAMTTIQAAYGHSLEQVREQLQPLAQVTGYRDVVKAIASCRALRVHVEERRKMLKADSLDYGRNVDAVAKQLTETIAAFEEPLKMRKADADQAKAREKQAKEDAERAEREAEARAKVEAEQAEARARMAAEQTELAARRAEIAKLKAEADAQAAAERAELLELRRQLAQERSQAATEAAEAAAQLSRLQKESEAAQTRARLAAEAEEQRAARERHEKELEAKKAAAVPDRTALAVWAALIGEARQHAPLGLQDRDAIAMVFGVTDALDGLCNELRSFDGTPEVWQMPDPHAALRTFGEVIDVNERLLEVDRANR